MQTFEHQTTCSEVILLDELMVRLGQHPSSSLGPLIKELPLVYRLTNIEVSKVSSHQYSVVAEIYHDQASLRVQWNSSHVDTRLKVGALVGIRWKGETKSELGAIKISRLMVMDLPSADINLFNTIPPRWLNDRSLANRASIVFKELPKQFKYLWNAIFWEEERFHALVTYPSSLNNHHAQTHGNLLHLVECCELALKVSITENVNQGLLLMLCMLHDAGKAAEYTYQESRHQYYLSERGLLLGHKVTVLEWMITAKTQYQIPIKQSEWLALLHGLTAIQGAPDWMGIRSPVMIEAIIMSHVDNLSGKQSLWSDLAIETTGFGKSHPHLKARPYFVKPE